MKQPKLREGFHWASEEERRAAKIPPMYVHAQVADGPGRLRATAVSPNTGKTLYFYSDEHKVERDVEKWARVRYITQSIDKLVPRIDEDAAAGRPEALTLRLILQTGMRNGGEPQGALRDSKDSYGASSLLLQHVQLRPPFGLRLTFPGKKGVPQEFEIEDGMLFEYVKRRQAEGVVRLFPHQANATLRYLHKLDPLIKVHDLRAWYATTLAEAAKPVFEAEVSAKKLPKAVAKVVAKQLGNTAGVAQRAYMDPALFAEREEEEE